ncbi:hypothetical protein PPERSA_06884 [Pseudocohnilembus persalinus]|uniref:Uncharacterized protein n=1 Tax=Pseudocohnilembus persalinus TaxID=266149 RepID=A0A0V0QZF4_PSEPJ|nr:hypothetical protein PPERSA_06884 [Pseudocohnilembus persalinus]|eukprot:KRX07269.1 hypothetical protein PPERSA_06884 [Pseudocohnilembus persalinus]
MFQSGNINDSKCQIDQNVNKQNENQFQYVKQQQNNSEIQTQNLSQSCNHKQVYNQKIYQKVKNSFILEKYDTKVNFIVQTEGIIQDCKIYPILQELQEKNQLKIDTIDFQNNDQFKPQQQFIFNQLFQNILEGIQENENQEFNQKCDNINNQIDTDYSENQENTLFDSQQSQLNFQKVCSNCSIEQSDFNQNQQQKIVFILQFSDLKKDLDFVHQQNFEDEQEKIKQYINETQLELIFDNFDLTKQNLLKKYEVKKNIDFKQNYGIQNFDQIEVEQEQEQILSNKEKQCYKQMLKVLFEKIIINVKINIFASKGYIAQKEQIHYLMVRLFHISNYNVRIWTPNYIEDSFKFQAFQGLAKCIPKTKIDNLHIHLPIENLKCQISMIIQNEIITNSKYYQELYIKLEGQTKTVIFHSVKDKKLIFSPFFCWDLEQSKLKIRKNFCEDPVFDEILEMQNKAMTNLFDKAIQKGQHVKTLEIEYTQKLDQIVKFIKNQRLGMINNLKLNLTINENNYGFQPIKEEIKSLLCVINGKNQSLNNFELVITENSQLCSDICNIQQYQSYKGCSPGLNFFRCLTCYITQFIGQIKSLKLQDKCGQLVLEPKKFIEYQLNLCFQQDYLVKLADNFYYERQSNSEYLYTKFNKIDLDFNKEILNMLYRNKINTQRKIIIFIEDVNERNYIEFLIQQLSNKDTEKKIDQLIIIDEININQTLLTELNTNNIIKNYYNIEFDRQFLPRHQDNPYQTVTVQILQLKQQYQLQDCTDFNEIQTI